MINNIWSPEAIDRIRQLANEGMSYGQIAIAYSKEQNQTFSRNMIQGICVRNSIKTNYTPTIVWKAPRVVTVGALLDEPEPIGPIGDIPAFGCRFIRGEVNEQFRMCGHPGFPWCDYHKSRVQSSGKAWRL